MGEWLLSRKDRLMVARHVVPLEFGHLQKVTSRDFHPEAEGAASRRDDTDRSLARSAWKSGPRKNRPVGYGMIGVANPRGVSHRNVCRVS
jgi:hypothetical protein